MSRTTLVVLLLVLALGALPCRAQDKVAPSRKPGELRVYVYDGANKPVAPPSDARIYLEPKAGGRRVVRPRLVAGTSAASDTLHHGGQLRRLRGAGTVELVILAPDAARVASSSQSYLAAELDLLEYACPMKCAVDVKPGDCPACGMDMLPSVLELEAVVALKLGGEWTNARGFRFPPIQPPKTLRDGIDQIAALAAEIKARVDEGKLDRVHTPALGVSEIGKLLRGLATEAKVDDTAVAPVAARLTALGQELDRAADAECTVDTQKLLAELQSRVETLRGLPAKKSRPAAVDVDKWEGLSTEDKRAAEAQGACPISGGPLGSMGTPVKIVLDGQAVFLCCAGCEDKATADRKETLKKVSDGR